MTGFETYSKFYVPIKTHFNSVDFDYYRFNGKVSVNKNSYSKRNDQVLFKILAKKENELLPIMVSYFLNNPRTYIRDILDDDFEIYKRWMETTQSMTYNFKKDCYNLKGFMIEENLHFGHLFQRSENNQHPLLLQQLQIGGIHIETFMILEKIFKFFSKFDQKITEPLIWEIISERCNNYFPFFDRLIHIKIPQCERIITDIFIN